jgi:hypothetical protein
MYLRSFNADRLYSWAPRNHARWPSAAAFPQALANLTKAFMKRLLVPQRHYGGNLHGVSRGDVARR